MELGRKIRDARIRHNMTQEKLADLLGVTKSTISKYELGHRYPSSEQLRILATILSIPEFHHFLDFDGEAIAMDFLLDYLQERNLPATIVALHNDQNDLESKLLNTFSQLNKEGQLKAIERVEELTEIPKYKKETPPENPEA